MIVICTTHIANVDSSHWKVCPVEVQIAETEEEEKVY